MKIKNNKHLTNEQEKIVQDMFDYMQKLASKAKDECYSQVCDIDIEERAKVIESILTEIATFGNYITLELQYEARTDDGLLLTQKIYYEVFEYYNRIRREMRQLGREK